MRLIPLFSFFLFDKTKNFPILKNRNIKKIIAMNKNKLTKLIKETKGRFFSIKFQKANGDIRIANGKNYYCHLLNGGQSTHGGSESAPFVDRNKNSFISANARRVISFKCGGLEYHG